MSKNTLYITFDGLSDPLGQSQIMPYVKGISSEGYHIHVISCEKKKRLPAEKENIKRSFQGRSITWHYILYDEGGGIFTRWRYVWQLRAIARKIVTKQVISLIHCRSYLASLIGLHFLSTKRIPFIFDMRGFWADERIDGGIWNKKNPAHYILYRYFKRKELQCLKRSAAVVSLTKAGLEELHLKNPGLHLPSKTTVIPCCTDTAFFDPSGYKNRSADHVIVYTGSIGTWYYTREMIDCMLIWKERIPALKLLILTRDTEALDQVLANYDKALTEDLIIQASASYQQVPEFLSKASASVFFIKPAYSKIASSPTKMAECWSMGIPILSNAGIGDNDHFFREKQGGILLEEFSNEAYARACEEYLKLNQPPAHYRNIALENFDNRLATEKYLGIYKRLTGSSGGKQ